MTDHQTLGPGTPGHLPVVEDRHMRPCTCGRCSTGAPVADLVALAPMFSNGDPSKTAHKPLANPYDAPRGELVYDVLTGRLGVVMERVGRTVHLRPETGGCEWETDHRFIERPPARTTADPHRPLVDTVQPRTAEGALALNRSNLPPPASAA
ncbi:hypothetical protein [Kitasatospora sp. A2-31]|uniref:hypothetical protein n=1 Tax=Kitasatospora sp. A2-31 TaxID=2916414 RepID=UPI001EEF5F74|nr:hypothetical protein [Kitasatospora sp. A2-31]MCG6499176.1 hypothetical protein [Kitasatospora sp. A2-31]